MMAFFFAPHAAAAASMDPPDAPPNYSCLRCGEKIHLSSRDAIKCPCCEYRIMMKLPSRHVRHQVQAR
jgi:DNA-directed RNA polymerase subunit RPC12/RpoP